MWALPTLSVLDVENLQHQLDDNALWCLLLFPKADKAILRGLQQNWDRFSMALGYSVHVITLLESNNPNSAEGLKFPKNYETSVGKFCSALRIRLDALPALFLINATDNRGSPYWPLGRNPQVGAQALEQLVSDLCDATYDLSHDLDPVAWRNAAAAKFLDARSSQQIVQFIRGKVNLQTLTRFLITAVKGHLGSQ
jgi:hypothetical protein